jgi:hypothetical protein
MEREGQPRFKHLVVQEYSRNRPRYTRVIFNSISILRAIPHLGHVDDDELKRLAVSWRAQALRGDREAYGIANALEVERRRRFRDNQMAQFTPEAVVSPRPWWKFWATNRGPDQDSMSST